MQFNIINWHLFLKTCFKVEKMKINASYPFIVPKSYDEFSPKYRVEDNSNTVTDCQVIPK